MNVYDGVTMLVGSALGLTATGTLVWAAFHDDLGDQTGEADGMGQVIEPDGRDDDQLARIALGGAFTDHTTPGVSSLWRNQ